jgi:hypothetical protein
MLEEAGQELLTFYAFPARQWKSLRSTNVIERLHGELRGRIKSQAVWTTEDGMLNLLHGLFAAGIIRSRRIDGFANIVRTQPATEAHKCESGRGAGQFPQQSGRYLKKAVQIEPHETSFKEYARQAENARRRKAQKEHDRLMAEDRDAFNVFICTRLLDGPTVPETIHCPNCPTPGLVWECHGTRRQGTDGRASYATDVARCWTSRKSGEPEGAGVRMSSNPGQRNESKKATLAHRSAMVVEDLKVGLEPAVVPDH